MVAWVPKGERSCKFCSGFRAAGRGEGKLNGKTSWGAFKGANVFVVMFVCRLLEEILREWIFSCEVYL